MPLVIARYIGFKDFYCQGTTKLFFSSLVVLIMIYCHHVVKCYHSRWASTFVSSATSAQSALDMSEVEPPQQFSCKRTNTQITKHHYGVMTVNRKLMPNLTYRLMVDVYNCCAIGGGGITVGVSVKTLDIFHNLMLTDVGKLVRMK